MKGHNLLVAALLTITLVFIHSFVAADFKGKIVRVIDGDTIEVLHNHHPERIRLNGIDCPELGQAYGKKAKQAASALAFGQTVTIQEHGLDK